MNLYLGSGSIEISTVLTKSPVYEHGMSCQFLVPCSTFSVWCVVFSELVVSLWRPCVPPSLISESVVEGWVREEMQCLFLPSQLFSDDVQHRFPWALCPYLSPQEEYLLGIPLRSGCWHCCFSVPKAHEYLGCVHEPRKYLEMNHQIKPVKCCAETVAVQFTGLQVLCLSRLETKERSQSCQRYQRFKRWDDFHVWSKRILERHPLRIAGDRQKTAAAEFFSWWGLGSRESTSSSRNEQQFGSLVNWLPWEPVEHHIPLFTPQAKYFHGAEFLSLLIYQQTAILKWPENAEEIIRREKITEGC